MSKGLLNAFGVPLAALLISLLVVGCDTRDPVEIPPPVEPEKVLLDVAGTQGVDGSGGDGGPAVACSLRWPTDVTVTDDGALAIVDRGNHRIRMVTRDGAIEAFIGSGFMGDDTSGPGPIVDLNNPVEIRLSKDRDYYVSCAYNFMVKAFERVSLECSPVAGSGVRGFRGDGGPARMARLDEPSSLIFDPGGNMFIVDNGNTRIRRVDGITGIMTTFAGGRRGSADGIGEAAEFAFPGCETYASWCGRAAIDIVPSGEDLLLADTENHAIRRINIASGMVTTIAGTHMPGWEGDGGPALSATLNFPCDIAVAANGDIYIADTHNHVIRRINSLGIITTVAGNGSIGSSPAGTPAVEAMLYNPEGIVFDDATNTLYIADTHNHQIRKVINP
jgi:hypothetical protein